MDRPRLTITLRELVDSGCVAGCCFSLRDEGALPPPGPADGTDGRPGRDAVLLNSAKISLLLARAFARCYAEELSAGGGRSNLSLAGLENAYVQLSNAGLSQAEHDALAGRLVYGRRAGAGGEGSKGTRGTADVPFGGVDSLFGADGDASGDGRGGTNGDCFGPPSDAGEGAGDLASIGPREWTLMEMSMYPAVTREVTVSDLRSRLRHLGGLIHAVFSRNGQRLPLPTNGGAVGDGSSSSSPPAPHVHSSLELEPRSSRRATDASLFSNLVARGDNPTSVCRLVSDLIDTGPGGMADCPFKSFDEVIEDLQKMSSLPHIFLFDAEDFKLSFGQQYYGQEKEITQLLAISTRMEHAVAETNASGSSPVSAQVEVAFVTGVAGQGKTHLVSRAGEFLSSLGCWMVAKTKFERGTEHESRQLMTSMFERLIAQIVAMRQSGNGSDVEYSIEAARAISGGIDRSSLLALANFTPSVRDLVPVSDAEDDDDGVKGSELKSWQLTFLLSKLMDVVLGLGRSVMLCVDDLQWCDPSILALIMEVITSFSNRKRQRCLVVGTYRSNEVDRSHPLRAGIDGLRSNGYVNVSEVRLSSLSREAVVEMVSTEMRLPRRLVADAADAVHRKTSGHALFVVQMLNALVRDGTMRRCRRAMRHVVDLDALAAVRTWESVASLIASNLSSLSDVDLRNLRMVCCLGMQVQLSTLDFLAGCPGFVAGSVRSSLVRLVGDGILERAGTSIKFSHDLIHQAVSENMTTELRKRFQFIIGTYLGSKAEIDKAVEEIPSLEQLNLGENDRGNTLRASITLIAVDMINNAGPKYVRGQSAEDQTELMRFARWNLHAASESRAKSNFRSALHYCKNGIAFLGEEPWSMKDMRLCRELHEKAAFASFATGNNADATEFATSIIQNVPFEQSLFAQLMILRSLESEEELEITIARGVALLRTLNFNIPSNPTPIVIMETMAQTEDVASQYSIEQIIDMQRRTVVDSIPCIYSTNVGDRNIMNLVEALAMACYQTGSPFYPLVTCTILNYSFQHGITVESATAFAVFGYFQIYLQGKYDSGRHWGQVAEKILENSNKPNIRAALSLYSFLYLWFKPLGELRDLLFDLYQLSLKTGNIDGAMFSLCQYWRFSFYGGSNLPILAKNYEKMKLMVKYTYGVAKYAVLDIAVTAELMGSPQNPYSWFEGSINDEAELFEDGELRNSNQQLQSIAFKRFLTAFFSGDYKKAATLSKEASSFPTSKVPKIQLIFHYFYYGLVSFNLFRQGEGQSYLSEGKEMLKKMNEWHRHSPHTFQNKLLLLEAEYFASMCNRNKSIEKYEASIRVARDNGFVHEMGIANEFMGHYLASIVELQESTECYKQAYKCYMQWGATAKAEKMQEDHNLDLDETANNTLKHARDAPRSTHILQENI